MPIRALFLAASLMALTPPAFAEDRQVDLPPFEAVDAAHGLTLDVTAGEQSVIASSDDPGHLDDLSLQVRDGVLYATLEESFFEFLVEGGLVGALLSGNAPVHVAVTMPEISALAASTGAAATVTQVPTPRAFTASASTGSRIDLENLEGGAIKLTASTGASLAARGTCETGTLEVSSGAQLEANELSCATVTANASSGGGMTLTARGTVSAHASTGGDVAVTGNPRSVEREESSGGHVTMR